MLKKFAPQSRLHFGTVPLGLKGGKKTHTRYQSARGKGPSVVLCRDGVVDGPDLTVTVDGMKFRNPFVIASGPPGTNYAVMKRALDEGWGGVICKSISLDHEEIRNVTPRYAQLRVHGSKDVVGWENIELTSDRPLSQMLDELKRLKEEYPDRRIIASILEINKRECWEELIERVEATGVDGFEINFSCPHGLPDLGMGMAMGQCPEPLAEVSRWVQNKTKLPVWAKMTPNITDITVPARVALKNGCSGISAINTIASVMGVNLDTLKPEPTVEGYTTLGGYSYKAVKPIALAHIQKCAKVIAEDFKGEKSLSGLGGIETGYDAAEFLLLGANTVQVCTGVMIHGYALVQKLCDDLRSFMKKHDFSTIDEFRGAALPYFTTHAQLLKLQTEARAQKRAARLITDADWSGDTFSDEAQSMVSN